MRAACLTVSAVSSNCLSRAPAPPPIIRPSDRADNGRCVDLSQRGRGFFSGTGSGGLQGQTAGNSPDHPLLKRRWHLGRLSPLEPRSRPTPWRQTPPWWRPPKHPVLGIVDVQTQIHWLPAGRPMRCRGPVAPPVLRPRIPARVTIDMPHIPRRTRGRSTRHSAHTPPLPWRPDARTSPEPVDGADRIGGRNGQRARVSAACPP
jgi:hypothetical protein